MSVQCPRCSEAMEVRREPDLHYERCPRCGGLFLDPGELNALATGMSGDIEYCSTELRGAEAECPERRCPKCDDVAMEKVNLLQFSSVIFDRCPSCSGFFLDRNEASEMNVYLDGMTGPGFHEELRERVGPYLVRVDVLSDVAAVPGRLFAGNVPAQTVTLQVAVFFEQALGLDLHVSPLAFTAKAAKLLGLYRGQDVETGDPELDSHFLFQGTEEAGIARLFSDEKVAERLKAATELEPIVRGAGRLEIDDTQIVYREGPYRKGDPIDAVSASETIRARLLELASAIRDARDARAPA